MHAKAYLPASRVALVQTVLPRGLYALWLDGVETGIRVELDSTDGHKMNGLDCLTLIIEAGQLEVME